MAADGLCAGRDFLRRLEIIMYYPLREVRILSGSRGNTFGWVRDGGKRVHQGWDFQAKDNTFLYAVADGEVVNVDRKDNSSYGCSILLRFQHWGADYYAFYAHINTSLVDKGEWVEAGSHIGYSGSTGNAKGSKSWAQHLHFEFRSQAFCGKGLEGRVNPEEFYGPPPFNWVSYDGPVTTDYYEEYLESAA